MIESALLPPSFSAKSVGTIAVFVLALFYASNTFPSTSLVVVGVVFGVWMSLGAFSLSQIARRHVVSAKSIFSSSHISEMGWFNTSSVKTWGNACGWVVTQMVNLIGYWSDPMLVGPSVSRNKDAVNGEHSVSLLIYRSSPEQATIIDSGCFGKKSLLITLRDSLLSTSVVQRHNFNTPTSRDNSEFIHEMSSAPDRRI